ncbi:MAG: TlpA family protein disulfide reductase [Bacteroidota bacterium]
MVIQHTDFSTSLRKIWILLPILAWLGVGCSSSPDHLEAPIRGTVTVDSTVDQSQNYEGIGLTIIRKDSSNADADTLFHAITDSTGFFSGLARFQQKGQYPLLVSRNNNQLGRVPIILSHKDTVEIQGSLPEINNSFEIDSYENNAFEVYQRVKKGFSRVALYARAGAIQADSLPGEIKKWSDLYWSVYEDYESTIAGKLAAVDAVRLLETYDSEQLLEKVRILEQDKELVGVAARKGKEAIAETEGLDEAVQYLNELKARDISRDMEMRIDMERIKLLYDSARVDEAQAELAEFQQNYTDMTDAKDWAKYIGYDLEYLAPGDTLPDFTVATLNGDTLSNASFRDQAFILEISSLSNGLYQRQYDRMLAIFQIYKNYGLQMVTIPLDPSPRTIEGFFEERVRLWAFAQAQSMDRDTILDQFNINRTPVRFLVDKNGKIVRKYVGNEIEDIVKGLQKAFDNSEKIES